MTLTSTASLHLLDVQADAQLHYHKKITEIYFILEGEGFMELDGQRVPVQPFLSHSDQTRLSSSRHRQAAGSHHGHSGL